MTPSQYKAIRDHLLKVDPDVVKAADEADQDLFDWFATLSTHQRLDRAAGMVADLARLCDAR